MLLECYERYGPIFTLRLFHGNVVFMLGPGGQPLHHRLPRLQLPLARGPLPRPDRPDGRRAADDRRRLPPPLAADHAAGLPPRAPRGLGRGDRGGDRARRSSELAPGTTVDLYAWTRRLALRVAMRALFGLDPDGERARSIDAAGDCSRRRSPSTPASTCCGCCRGRAQPVGAHAAGRAQARHADLRARSPRAARRASAASDILSLLLDAHDEDGNTLSDLQIRDEVMTLLFAGHDTTTSTVSFMFYELARQPEIAARLRGRAGRACSTDGRPSASQLLSGELPELEMVLDETLRKYPPAWVGPRRAVEPFEFEGHTVPARAFVNYCSWASHHLPDVFDGPGGVPPRALHARRRARRSQGRLRALRRRLADVHRDALRPARGAQRSRR